MLKYLIAGIMMLFVASAQAAENETIIVNLSINEIFTLNSGLMGLDG